MSRGSDFGVAFFASGKGSNFLAVLKKIEAGLIPARVSFVLSNNSGCRALKMAKKKGIPAYHVSDKTEALQSGVEGAMGRLLDLHRPQLLVLAGFMKKVPAGVIGKMKGRVINIHPGLLPAFGGQGWYGMKVHEGVIARGCQYTGMTIHAVNETYDEGPIILQRTVRVEHGETPGGLAEKVMRQEHRYLWEVVKAYATGVLSWGPRGEISGLEYFFSSLGKK